MKFRGLDEYYSVNEIVDTQTRGPVSFDEMMDDASDRRIIYIGETHENRYHHEVQLKVLKAVYERNPEIAIGMEMFQRPFQGVLDEYIEGKMDEKSFLKKSEYFKRWRFDYSYYRGIIDFAREKKIRIVALNISSSIIDKISEKGIDSLSEEEKEEVTDIDGYSEAHKELLRNVFTEHDIPEERFEFFYQAQLAWDQTMAWAVSEFIKKEEGYSMVVIAGAGHCLRYGIPDRVERFTGNSLDSGIDSRIIIPETLSEATWDIFEQDLADYVWFTKEPAEEDIRPRLMVVLSKDESGVVIKKVQSDGPADKAGVKEGDVILSMDDTKIEDIDDATIFMLNKKFGDTVRLKILREKEEVDIEVHLTPSKD